MCADNKSILFEMSKFEMKLLDLLHIYVDESKVVFLAQMYPHAALSQPVRLYLLLVQLCDIIY